MKNLFEIGADFAALEQLLTDVPDELSVESVEAMQQAKAMLDKWASELDTDQSTKIDNMRALFRKWASEKAVAKAMKEQYATFERSIDKKEIWLKNYIKAYMEQRGVTKITTDTLGEVWIQANGGVQALELDHTDWEKTSVYIITYGPDKELIRRRLEMGESMPFARLLPRTKSLRIK